MESNSSPIDFSQIPWRTITVKESKLDLAEVRLERTSNSIKIPTEKKKTGYTLYSPSQVITVPPKEVLQLATGIIVTKGVQFYSITAYPVSPILNLVELSPTVVLSDREIGLNFINADSNPIEIFPHTPIGLLTFLPAIHIQPQSVVII